MFNRWIGGRENGTQALAPYGVDIREDNDHFYVEAELPGYKKEEIDITLENQTLTIAAERRYENKQENGGKGELLLHERRYSRFLRSFTLPPTVDEGSVNARLADGVLTVTINKREEDQAAAGSRSGNSAARTRVYRCTGHARRITVRVPLAFPASRPRAAVKS
jgi:HSP20 family protein